MASPKEILDKYVTKPIDKMASPEATAKTFVEAQEERLDEADKVVGGAKNKAVGVINSAKEDAETLGGLAKDAYNKGKENLGKGVKYFTDKFGPKNK